MKSFNFKAWALSPRTQKWGLFGLLALSLGFNLSMNPEHFNNIARHEKPDSMYSMDLAQEVAKPAEAVKPPAVDSTTVTPKAVMAISAKNVTYTVSTFTLDGAEYVRFKPEGDNKPSTACLDYVNRPMKLEPANKKDIGALGAILTSSVCGDSSGSGSSPSEEKEKKVQKAGERSEISEALVKEGKRCDTLKSQNEVLKCHKKNLIAISKDVEDSKDHVDIINSYFNENIKDTLAGYFKNPTVNIRTGEENPDDLELANQMALDLVGKDGLRGKNGSGVVKAITVLKEQSYRAQLVNAQKFVITGRAIKNEKMKAFGANHMDGAFLSGIFGSDDSSFMKALESKPSDLTSFARSNFETPVETLLTNLTNFNTSTLQSGKSLEDQYGLYATYNINQSGLNGGALSSNVANSMASDILARIGQARNSNQGRRGNPIFGDTSNFAGPAPTYNGTTPLATTLANPNSNNFVAPTATAPSTVTNTPTATPAAASGRNARRASW